MEFLHLLCVVLALRVVKSSDECSGSSCANSTANSTDTLIEGMLNGYVPVDLVSGIEFCITDCSSKFDFLATYKTGLSNSDQMLCENEITSAVDGNGGPNCRADDWYIVEQCNEECYEFGWRATYPAYCDVEDKWLWCCEPKIKVEPAFMCGEFDSKDIPCVITDHHIKIETLVIRWLDKDGEDLSDIPGFDVSTTYRIDTDKLLSVLTVSSAAMTDFTKEITCQASRNNGQVGSWTESTTINKFDVTVEDVTIPKGDEAVLVCTGIGTGNKATVFYFSWYYIDQAGEKQIADTGITTQLQRNTDGNLQSILTVPSGTLGKQRYQCVLSHDKDDTCSGEVKTTTCSAEATITVWYTTPDTYCQKPFETGVLSTTIVGFEGLPLSAVEITSVRTGIVVTVDTHPDSGYSISGAYNEDGDLVVTLTVENDGTIGTEKFFITVNGYITEPNLDICVMSTQIGQRTDATVEVNEVDLLGFASIEGGIIDSPVWVDESGRIYRPQPEQDDGIIVTEEPTETTIYIPIAMIEELNIRELYVSFRVKTPAGTYCRRENLYLNLAIGECRVELDEVMNCAATQSCVPFTLTRDWSCVCKDGDNRKERCTPPAVSLSFDCPATAEYELSNWSEDDCDEENCYPYAKTRHRFCTCTSDVVALIEDESGGKCNQPILTQSYYCGATKQWAPSEWIRGACPDDSCFPSETLDTRDCTCDQFSDRAKCSEAMIQGRDCPATKDFEWTPWSEEVCETADRCYPSQEEATRSCSCENYGIEYRDVEKCEGETTQLYTCPANMPWSKVPIGNPCEEAGTDSCYSFWAVQNYKCTCQNGNDYEEDGNTDLCDGAPTDVSCAPNSDYDWSEWTSISECSYCYPELDQTQTRYCQCGEQEDKTRCVGPDRKAEPCPTTDDIKWIPTEWAAFPCGDIFCNQETFTTRERDCECEGNKDSTRCEEAMTDTMSCGVGEYDLTEWSSSVCDKPYCHAYEHTVTRSCKCTDITGESVDLNQCDAGLDDYSRKVMCEGDSYDWGEWQSRGCRETCVASTVKRYRVCQCHGDVDFNECDGNAIDFPECEIASWCGP